MRHIKHGDGMLHVADDVARAMDALGETLNRVGMNASITIPILGKTDSLTLKLVSEGDREIGIGPTEGLTQWRLADPCVLKARLVSSDYASHFSIGDDVH